MSFIIKGIDLPKNYNEPLMVEIYSNGDALVTTKEMSGYNKTEAIQIPKDHGRIGDLDGVIKRIDKSPTFASKYKGTARLFIKTYSDHETILEAEETNGEGKNTI